MERGAAAEAAMVVAIGTGEEVVMGKGVVAGTTSSAVLAAVKEQAGESRNRRSRSHSRIRRTRSQGLRRRSRHQKRGGMRSCTRRVLAGAQGGGLAPPRAAVAKATEVVSE